MDEQEHTAPEPLPSVDDALGRSLVWLHAAETETDRDLMARHIELANAWMGMAAEIRCRTDEDA